jgi:hypothetical protein
VLLPLLDVLALVCKIRSAQDPPRDDVATDGDGLPVREQEALGGALDPWPDVQAMTRRVHAAMMPCLAAAVEMDALSPSPRSLGESRSSAR